MKIYSKYVFFARYIPGLISIFPLTLVYFFITKKYSSYVLNEYFQSATFFLGISATFILTFFVSMIIREFGTFLEKKYFDNRIGFPTNYLMLYSNEALPTQTKELYGERLKSDFNLKRLDRIEEAGNVGEALKILSQASKLISTRYQQNEQVKDASIAYGFARNVSGGLFVSLPASIVGIVAGIIADQNSLLLWSSISAVIFFMISIFNKKWIKINAEKYAEKLISVYLSNS